VTQIFKGSVFVGPVNIAGIASRLADGLRQCDVDAEAVLAWPDRFQYSNTKSSFILLWQWAGKMRQAASAGSKLKKIFFVLLHKALGFLLLPWALFRFNAFIFLFAQTLTDSSLELKLLKLFKKRLIFVYVGSDARPPYMDGGRFPEGTPLPDAATLCKLTQDKKKLIKRQESFADYVVNSPFCGQFQERSYVNWFAMGVPFDADNQQAEEPDLPNTKRHSVRILHSPSSAAVKGTQRILTILDQLKRKGLDFELLLLQSTSNIEVIEEIKRCDFVIDQLFADTPLAVFATEAALFGKPAVVGGYAANSGKQLFASYGQPPSFFVSPSDMADAIERLIADKNYRDQLGMEAATFVKQHWNSTEVAKRYLKLLSNNCEADWLIDPHACDYALGNGLPAERSAMLTSNMMKQFGEESLCIGDKPAVLKQIKQNIDTHCGPANA
jgi:glycosyltransferase involved in cell wall biosynthesis